LPLKIKWSVSEKFPTTPSQAQTQRARRGELMTTYCFLARYGIIRGSTPSVNSTAFERKTKSYGARPIRSQSIEEPCEQSDAQGKTLHFEWRSAEKRRCHQRNIRRTTTISKI